MIFSSFSSEESVHTISNRSTVTNHRKEKMEIFNKFNLISGVTLIDQRRQIENIEDFIDDDRG